MGRRSFFLVCLLSVAGCRRLEADPVPHVRLGMAPRDVRAHFEPGAAGAWHSSVGVGDDTAIDWTASDGRSVEGPRKVRNARFEFHNGMLVAVRATTNETPPATEHIAATDSTVTVRRAAGSGGTEIEMLARDCPTHKDEAQSLVSRMK